ncbi:MAG: carboxymuconolactone decarboxylase family protein [Actinomycetota bacterium]
MSQTTDFPAYHAHLNELIAQLRAELPAAIGSFFRLHTESLRPGALDTKTKELISIGISITAHCDGCVAYHVHDALEAGASRDEVLETIGVAVMMGGGPALVYGAQALEALDQFEDKHLKTAGVAS